MSAITESFPFCYANKNTEKIRLHIVVNVPAGKKITFPGAGELSGQTKVFKIELEDDASATTNSYHYRNYDFNIKEEKETIDTVEIYTKIKNTGTNRIKTMKIVVSDMDTATTGWPEINDNPLLDAPYVCTKLVEVIEGGTNKYIGFDVEIYVISGTKKVFTYTQTDMKDDEKNTKTVIESVDDINGTFEYATPVHRFVIPNVHLAHGAHSASHKEKKSKTKNKNHTVTPFPRPKVRRKN